MQNGEYSKMNESQFDTQKNRGRRVVIQLLFILVGAFLVCQAETNLSKWVVLFFMGFCIRLDIFLSDFSQLNKEKIDKLETAKSAIFGVGLAILLYLSWVR
jgi:hypothetical protein